jgi:hypothetical protein
MLDYSQINVVNVIVCSSIQFKQCQDTNNIASFLKQEPAHTIRRVKEFKVNNQPASCQKFLSINQREFC